MPAQVPGGLLAIRTGTASGLCVVDIDPRNGGQLDRALMTPTATVATGGGGWHLYYRHPGGPTLPRCPARPGSTSRATAGTLPRRPRSTPAPAALPVGRSTGLWLRCPPRCARP